MTLTVIFSIRYVGLRAFIPSYVQLNASILLFALFYESLAIGPFCGRRAVSYFWTGQIALIRAYQPTYVDHFYTTDGDEMNNAVTNLGCGLEGDAAYVSTTAETSTIPLYRMYNPSAVDHFYTTSYSEVQSAGSADSDYTHEGIAGY
ncbi:hypothetical protein DFH29DRAFT_997880 [Suillus ampliporus]|nr:hypothetical protein DFH29DRAFT_997880 [Suillus ampliporus]